MRRTRNLATKGNRASIRNAPSTFGETTSLTDSILANSVPALVYAKAPGNMPKKLTIAYVRVGIVVMPMPRFSNQKGIPGISRIVRK